MQPRVLDQLLEATALLQKDLERAFEGTPLTTARTHLLWTLRAGAMTQQALATALEVSPRNVTGLVDALEASGFVIRRPHPTDRRATLVSLTESGKQAMARMERDHDALSHHLVADLELTEVVQLERGLAVVLDRLRAMLADAEGHPETEEA